MTFFKSLVILLPFIFLLFLQVNSQYRWPRNSRWNYGGRNAWSSNAYGNSIMNWNNPWNNRQIYSSFGGQPITRPGYQSSKPSYMRPGQSFYGKKEIVTANCDEKDCYVNCRLQLLGGGKCTAGGCMCYITDLYPNGAPVHTRHQSDFIWYSLDVWEKDKIVEAMQNGEPVISDSKPKPPVSATPSPDPQCTGPFSIRCNYKCKQDGFSSGECDSDRKCICSGGEATTSKPNYWQTSTTENWFGMPDKRTTTTTTTTSKPLYNLPTKGPFDDGNDWFGGGGSDKGDETSSGNGFDNGFDDEDDNGFGNDNGDDDWFGGGDDSFDFK